MNDELLASGLKATSMVANLIGVAYSLALFTASFLAVDKVVIFICSFMAHSWVKNMSEPLSIYTPLALIIADIYLASLCTSVEEIPLFLLALCSSSTYVIYGIQAKQDRQEVAPVKTIKTK